MLIYDSHTRNIRFSVNNVWFSFLTVDLLNLINRLQVGVAFPYPLKTSENLKVSDVFRGYRKATPGCNGLIETRLTEISVLFDFPICKFYTLSK